MPGRRPSTSRASADHAIVSSTGDDAVVNVTAPASRASTNAASRNSHIDPDRAARSDREERRVRELRIRRP